eukprot:CAMPEP_0206527780 /NCGR_PEP_ID=MMETSP0325_2-20121206/1552_1 /ASSEMBLY_ACC=CAM_ASM_000347 /TAXON_ID=2866 /ORGANISM="Crypthecodinium cohnii, Strain Seligo" /LENGTH=262 /DNA_ID=CAMNT_0054023255 /DNA_START=92 /DNA_END=880 /DNA_ORIENTATION=+
MLMHSMEPWIPDWMEEDVELEEVPEISLSKDGDWRQQGIPLHFLKTYNWTGNYLAESTDSGEETGSRSSTSDLVEGLASHSREHFCGHYHGDLQIVFPQKVSGPPGLTLCDGLPFKGEAVALAEPSLLGSQTRGRSDHSATTANAPLPAGPLPASSESGPLPPGPLNGTVTTLPPMLPSQVPRGIRRPLQVGLVSPEEQNSGAQLTPDASERCEFGVNSFRQSFLKGQRTKKVRPSKHNRESLRRASQSAEAEARQIIKVSV